jgi:membrane-bound lytic murein transglycosylase F
MRLVPVSVLMTCLALAMFTYLGDDVAQPPAVEAPPPIDPRIEAGARGRTGPYGGGAVDDIEGSDSQGRFAHALTAHRRTIYTGDLDDIRARGVLRVLTRNNSTSYFLYQGVEAGFDYELARWIARELGVRLEMVVAPTRRELVPWLLDGKGDLILAGLSTEAQRAHRVRFTRPYLETPWAVVTRARGPRIEKPEDLAGVDMLVRPSSGVIPRLRALGIGHLDLRGALEGLESEDLLEAVAHRDVTACVVEERIAKVELMHRHGLRIALTLPGTDTAGIAVRREDEQLAAFLDDFVLRHRKSTEWNVTYMKYHSWRERTAAVRDESLRADREGRLSRFDEHFKRAGAEADVDWRLLAAQAYQESRFDPEARSPFGAVGVMQLLPSTAKELGCEDPTQPGAAIRAGARYLGKLMKRFEDEPEVALKDRVRFALAAYNVGLAHLDDARVLADRLGLDRNRWFGNVEEAVRLLASPKHYQTLRYGYARGDETVRYVSEIQTRYDAYVALTTPGPTAKR